MAQRKTKHAFYEPKAALVVAERRIQKARRTGAKALDLGKLDLTELPESIGELIELEELMLWGNRLTTLPESLSELKELRRLYLAAFGAAGNQFKEIPQSIRGLSRLVFIQANDCHIASVPAWLGELKTL